jgi:hypothetical protein
MASLTALRVKEVLGCLWISFLGDEQGLHRKILDIVHEELPLSIFWSSFMICAADVVSWSYCVTLNTG